MTGGTSSNLDALEIAPPPAPERLLPATAVAAPSPPAAERGRLVRDGRSARRTGRTVQVATRVTPDFDERFRIIAERNGLLHVELLEKSLAIFVIAAAASRAKRLWITVGLPQIPRPPSTGLAGEATPVQLFFLLRARNRARRRPWRGFSYDPAPASRSAGGERAAARKHVTTGRNVVRSSSRCRTDLSRVRRSRGRWDAAEAGRPDGCRAHRYHGLPLLAPAPETEGGRGAGGRAKARNVSHHRRV